MAKRFYFSIDQFQQVHDLHDLKFRPSTSRNCHCKVYVLRFKVSLYNRLTAGVKRNFKVVGTINITGPL